MVPCLCQVPRHRPPLLDEQLERHLGAEIEPLDLDEVAAHAEIALLRNYSL